MYTLYHLYLQIIFDFLDNPYWIVIVLPVVIQTSGVSWTFEDECFPAKIRTGPCPHPKCFSYHLYGYHQCGWAVITLFQQVSPFQNKSLLILMVSIFFHLLWKQEQNPFPNCNMRRLGLFVGGLFCPAQFPSCLVPEKITQRNLYKL